MNTVVVNSTLALTTINIAKYRTQNKFSKILMEVKIFQRIK